MLTVRGLTKSYGTVVAVRDLALEVQAGEILGLVGPNGAGKTTTLRCISGIIPPSEGEIRVAGRDLRADPVGAKREIAFFPDEPRLFEYLTVWQHLVFTARMYRVEDYAARGEELLRDLELEGKRDVLPGELSRGMKQKLAIACGFLHRPRLLIFDEPLTGLDPYGIRKMKQAIRRQADREGAAIVLSSHHLTLLQEVCSHVLILKEGRKVFDGTLAGAAERFGVLAGGTLEDVFFRATGSHEEGGPAEGAPAGPGAGPPPLPPAAESPPAPPPVASPPAGGPPSATTPDPLPPAA